jgi:hypothetical protein
MTANTTQVKAALTEFMGSDVETVARATKFVQRQSSLGGLEFLETTVLGFLENAEASLNDLTQTSADLGVDITQQGLDQRINPRALAFLEQMFARAMELFKQRASLPISLLKQFNGVYLTDSSVIALPDSMAEDYPGCGGSGPQASVKVQLTFDFLTHHIEQVTLRAGRDTDRAYSGYTQVLPEGSLSITDLGYFSLRPLETITDEHQAYVLTRLDTTHTKVLTPEGAEIGLLALAKQGGPQACEHEVLVGKSYRLPFRLLIFPVPQEVAEERRRKAKENARRKKRTVSPRHLALQSWSFFITNAPAEKLPLDAAAILYRVRWQIELLFKLCKSHCGLKHVAGFRRERILVELYAKLIGVVITQFLLAPLRVPDEVRVSKREISPVKVRKIFRRFVRDLARALVHKMDLEEVLSQLLMHIGQFGYMEKRTKKPNLCHELALVSAACGFD